MECTIFINVNNECDEGLRDICKIVRNLITRNCKVYHV